MKMQQKDAAAILAILTTSEELFKKGDAPTRAALFTEDALIVTQDGPFYGRQAIEKYYADTFQNWRFINPVIKADQNSPHALGTTGNEAWSNGEWSCAIQGKSGDPIQLNGYWSAVYVREGDAWKIRLDTSVPAAAPSPTAKP